MYYTGSEMFYKIQQFWISYPLDILLAIKIIKYNENSFNNFWPVQSKVYLLSPLSNLCMFTNAAAYNLGSTDVEGNLYVQSLSLPKYTTDISA